MFQYLGFIKVKFFFYTRFRQQIEYTLCFELFYCYWVWNKLVDDWQGRLKINTYFFKNNNYNISPQSWFLFIVFHSIWTTFTILKSVLRWNICKYCNCFFLINHYLLHQQYINCLLLLLRTYIVGSDSDWRYLKNFSELLNL